MGILFKAPAALIYVVCGFWGLFITFDIVRDTLGLVVAVIGLFVAPMYLVLVPWYAAIAQGDWFPLLLIYGGGIGGSVLYGIGAAIDRE